MKSKTMTMTKLASMIAKAEGKKHQASIGDIREILKILARLMLATPGVYTCLVRSALWREKAAKKK